VPGEAKDYIISLKRRSVRPLASRRHVTPVSTETRRVARACPRTIHVATEINSPENLIGLMFFQIAAFT
jgi:hypothetical protein